MSGTLDLTGYKLTFDDEFNLFNWNSAGVPGNGTWQTNFYFGGRSLPSNGELETYSDASTGTTPFTILPSGDMSGHSMLQIQARPDGKGGYSSGLITTEPSFTQTYGYFEMRAKLPTGQGLWPAFWLLAADKVWPPELDVMEGFGSKATQYHWGAISGNSMQSAGNWADVLANTQNSFHTYGMNWDPTHITYYFDGQKIGQIATPADMNKPMYLLANLAVGGTWPGNPDGSTPFPANMSIDYIHAYSHDPNAQAVTPQAGYAGPDSGGTGPLPQTAAAAAHAAPAVASVAPTVTQPAGTISVSSGDNFINDTYGDGATRYGGTGNDTFVVADPNIHFLLPVQHGVETIDAWLDYTLPAGFNNIYVGANYGLHITGNSGSNILTGNVGNDVIDGGAGGDDIMTGGGGDNIFIVHAGGGYDTITDFKRSGSKDLVLLDGYGLPDFAAIQAALRQVGSDVVLIFNNGETLTFKDHFVSDFAAGDFQITNLTAATPVPPPTPAPSPSTAPPPSDTLILHVSGDRYNGDPQFTVFVDGTQIGSIYGTHAAHAQGQWQNITLSGNFGPGAHQIDVNFINDGWDGQPGDGHDRNLYVGSITLDGQVYLGSTATNNAAAGAAGVDPNAAVMLSNGTASFHATIATPTPVPPGGIAHPTPDVPHVLVLAGSDGRAIGGPSPSDLYATGPHETLIGNGGNDTFHIGDYGDTIVSEKGSGISTVFESATTYHLAPSVDNLTVTGAYTHHVIGNLRNNYVVLSDGNDAVATGGGNDTIVVGTGANKLNGGPGDDIFVFPKLADHNNEVTDFLPGHDVLDLRGLFQAIPYNGLDPVHDNVLHIRQAGGNTAITIDPHANSDAAAHLVVTLDHVIPSALKLGVDILWH